MQRLRILLVVVVNVKKVGMIFKRCPSILGSFRIGLREGYILIWQVHILVLCGKLLKMLTLNGLK